jgi:amino acid permease
LKKYLGVALALPFIAICLLLGTKSLLKYSTILGFYLIFKKKDNKEKKT